MKSHQVVLHIPVKKRGAGSLKNELSAGSGRRETTSESEMQAGEELAFSEFVRLMGATREKEEPTVSGSALC
jgi:hypothetical protein